MGKYKAFLIDINGTLYDYWGARNSAFEYVVNDALFRLSGNAFEKSVVASHINRIKQLEGELREKKYSLRDISIMRFRIWLDEAMNIKYETEENEELSKKLYQSYTQLTDDFIKIYPDVIPFLDILSSKGYILALASNGPSANQIRRLSKLDLYKYFSYSFFSEDMGVGKPDPLFYDKIFDTIQIGKEQCMAIGDDIVEDVSGALDYGFDAVWLNRKNKSIEIAPRDNCLTIASLSDLYTLIEI